VQKYPNSFLAFLSREQIERPFAWLIVLSLWFEFGDVISLSGKFNTYYINILRGLFAFQTMHILFLLVDAGKASLQLAAEKTQGTWDDQLVPFASKAIKTLIAVLGVLIVLQSSGLNVMSLLAGLGLGGLALALAAQDTAANLFGSITILADHPFKVGDWIKIANNEGTVEEIGFRSTRIRTFYNSVITIPNAMMAKEIIDNMGVRPLRRIRQVLGLTYETPPQKIEEFCEQIHYLLKQNSIVDPNSIIVNFMNFNSSSLDVLVNFHVNVATGSEELKFQQEIFFEIMKIASNLRVEFAYPTQMVHYKNLPS
jgi:MscS family membrane protein